MNEPSPIAYCNFCGKPATEVKGLLTGNGAAICNDCISRYQETLTQLPLTSKPRPREQFTVPRPAEIKQHLDLYCVGQEQAKKTLAVAVHNHYKRIQQNLQHPEGDDVQIEKSNILMTGPTGSGKTLLARTLAKVLDVPFAMVDVTMLAEETDGQVDAELILLRLLQNADYQPEAARHGIVYIDEIDKIAHQAAGTDGHGSHYGKRLQQTLLKIIEGTVCRITVQDEERFPKPQVIRLDTSEILFICGGAFVGLEKIIQRRLGRSTLAHTQKNAIAARDEILLRVEPEDLLQFGLIPEFVGRLPVIATLLPLDENQLVAALTEPKNALVKQYVKLLAMEGVELEFTSDALRELASQALLKETGARALRGLVERIMLDVMYEAPESTNPVHVKITKPVVEGKIKPVVQHHYWGGTS